MRNGGWITAVTTVILGLGNLAGCQSGTPDDAKIAPEVKPPAVLSLSSPDFADGQPIPERYSADGQNTSPPLNWGDLPAATRELALVVEDMDTAKVFVHWIVYKIPPSLKGLPAGGMPSVRVREGTNSNGRIAYFGPQPQTGKRDHYLFTLYAVDTLLDLNEGATVDQLAAAMKGHVIGRGRLIGTYPR